MVNSKSFARVRGVLAFMIGIFGALAILGVFFKILKLDNYELFMKIGFVGEACAFVVMGVLELMTNFAHEPDAHHAAATGDRSPMPTQLSAMVDAKLDAKLDEMLMNLAGDIDHFRGEMSTLSSELSHSAGAVRHMRSQLESVASADLAGDAQLLGQGMAALGQEMASAGSAVEAMRDDLDLMLQRFRGFNTVQHPSSDHTPIAHRGRRAS